MNLVLMRSIVVAICVCWIPASPAESAPPKRQAAADKNAAKAAAPHAAPAAVEWFDDYAEAMKRAELGRKMLLVYFYQVQPSTNQTRFESESLADPQAVERLSREYVSVRVPVDYEVSVGGVKSQLIEHEAFNELHRRAGLAVIDFAHDDETLHGYVVSILPLDNGKYFRFDPRHFSTLLELPPGTLTQRTMIFAVRIHPERPQSTGGQPNTTLFGEAREHSHYQARIRKQGHHNWGSRFQRITSLLPRGLMAKEVVAESWPGESLVDAAVDCVDCWRQSSGHWSAVRADQPTYGYDMKRGSNGIWYATGLFGNSE